MPTPHQNRHILKQIILEVYLKNEENLRKPLQIKWSYKIKRTAKVMTSINNLIKVKVFKDEVPQMETEEIQYVGQIFKFKCPRFLSVKLTTGKQIDIYEIQKLEWKVRKKKKKELLLIGIKQYRSVLTGFL